VRYQTLDEMLSGLRAEARISQNAAHGLTLRDTHTYLLNRIQEDLWLNYDWPHLKATAIVDISPGQRYVEYPANIIFESVEGIWAARSDQKYYPITYGIDVEHYNRRDPSDATKRKTPVERWTNYVPSTGNTNQNMFEIWPVPDVATKLIVKGRRSCQLLADDADKSTLDGPAIVLHAAAEILAGQKAEDASLKLNKAQERIRTLKLRQVGPDNRPLNMAGPTGYPRAARAGIDYIES
jgi:hypothetical protein